jgi:hypothetical protein
MTVTIRLDGDTPAELDTYETALRTVLDAPAADRDYPNRRGMGARRYLKPTSVRADAAGDGDEQGLSPRAVAEGFKRGRDLLGEISSLRAADADLERRPWFPLQPGDVVLMYLAADEHSPAFGETYLAVGDDTDIAGNAMLRQVSRTPQPWDNAGETETSAEAQPEYLLRYDRDEQRWVLDSEDIDGSLILWRSEPNGLGLDSEEDAQAWAGAAVLEIEVDRELTGWRDLPDRGQVPVFAGDDDQAATVGEMLTPFYDLWFEAGPGMLTVIRAGVLVHGRPATAAAVAAGKGA